MFLCCISLYLTTVEGNENNEEISSKDNISTESIIDLPPAQDKKELLTSEECNGGVHMIVEKGFCINEVQKDEGPNLTTGHKEDKPIQSQIESKEANDAGMPQPDVIARKEILVHTEEPREMVKRKNELLTIFVIGRTGVGKSTLINTLLEKKVATVSDDIFPCAQETMKECRGDFCGTETLFYDTKGLADPEEDDEKLLKTLYDAIAMCNTQYIVFICLPLISKVDRSVYSLAKFLVSKFGENYSIWLNSVIVLTQANLFSPQNDEEDSDDDNNDRKLKIKQIKMLDKMENWSKEFKTCLERFGLPKEIILNMPVSVAGKRNSNLPIMDNWKEALLDTCLKRRKGLQSIKEMEKCAKRSSAYIGMIVGGMACCVVPVIGVQVGMTVGGLIGWKIGDNSYREAVKEAEQKKFQKRHL